MVDVRIATPSDARAIALVHVDSWRWAYAGLVMASTLDALDVDDQERQWAAWLTRAAEDPIQTLVAEIDGRVVGFCGYGPSRDDASERTGEIYTLYRLEGAGHLGVGSALLGAARTRLRELGYEDATLWAFRDNDAACRFYEANGWTRDGETGLLGLDEPEGPLYPIVRFRATRL